MSLCLMPQISNVWRCPRSRTSSPRPVRSLTDSRHYKKARTMPIEILMPALSPTMTEGNLAKWLKKEGDEVHSGDVLAEIETDKATMEVEAVDDGKIGRILVPEGAQGIKVNAPIALLLGEDEDASSLQNFTADLPQPAPAAPPPTVESVQSAPAPAATPTSESGNERIFASPLARRMAQQAGLDLGGIRGSGPQ